MMDFTYEIDNSSEFAGHFAKDFKQNDEELPKVMPSQSFRGLGSIVTSHQLVMVGIPISEICHRERPALCQRES